jgi:PAS domain S-box-containing protein
VRRDETGADHLVARVGVESSELELALWPLADAASKAVVVRDLFARFGRSFPGGPWPEAATEALVVPIANAARPGAPAGFLVCGVSPRLSLDDEYRVFVEGVGAQVATAIAVATSSEEERRRAEQLAELDRAKTAFFSNVSHEFRTPLTLMLGPLEEILAQPDGLPAERRETLEVVERNGRRLLRLVNTLLDFSRIEAGRVHAAFEPTDLAALTADLASVFRAAVETAGMRLVVDCPPLPEPVYVDRDMWEKIVLNLVSNAFKYTLEGEIRVGLHLRDGAAELTVRDTGIGIPAAELQNLFNRFHRVEGARGRTQEGSGIGLALVQELARLHGATVAVDSVEGEGSTFAVRVPLGSAHLPPDRIEASQSLASTAVGASAFVEEAFRWIPASGVDAPFLDAPPRSTAAGPRPRVVLADDNADMRDYVARLLEGAYDVTAVGDGEAALAEALARTPDLVLSDVMMPRLDGFGLLERLRADETLRTVPVILLSARAGEESRVEGLEAGADDYLVKPFGARELLARVSANLEMARVRAEAAIRERALREEADAARERSAMLLESITDGFVGLDREWRYVYVNAEAERITGLPRAQMLGRTHWQINPDLVGTSLEAELRRAMHDRTGVHFAFDHRASDRWLEYVVSPSSDGGISVFFRDITEWKRAEVGRAEALDREQAARQRAEEASRAKDEFLATVSHELRTPLNSILGWARLLRSGSLDDVTAARALETIERNTISQAQLIEDLLDISRITTGKLRLNVQQIELDAVIRAAIDSVRPAADAKGIRLQSVLDTFTGTLLGDPERLQQVVWNLLSNAVKFTPRGGHVQVQLERVDSHLELTVADTGRGIAPAFLPYVFERFRQADASMTREVGGLGLGLAIVRHIAELHGGSVSVASEGEGRGAAFTVRLPLTLSRRDTRAEERVHTTAWEPVPFLGGNGLAGVRLLAVDDEVDTRDLLAHVLAGCGADVRTAASVRDALELLDSGDGWTADVLVSDVGMPVEDGYALIRAVRGHASEHVRRVPALALTAYARAEDRVRLISAGFEAHLPKPVEPAELVAVVESLTRRNR